MVLGYFINQGSVMKTTNSIFTGNARQSILPVKIEQPNTTLISNARGYRNLELLQGCCLECFIGEQMD